MRYVKLCSDAAGRSYFEDVNTDPEPRFVVEGVPPLLLSGPFPVSGLVFVEQPQGAPDWEPHVAPRRRWLIVLRGRAALTVSDGERREFGPGEIVLAEDTDGYEHLSVPLPKT